MITKHFWKFLAGFLGLVVLGVGVVYFADYFGEGGVARREAERQREFYNEWVKKYEEDTYGGTTPEETLELFISALEARDLDLAAKYFVIDEQEKWLENLERIKDGNQLETMFTDLKNTERGEDLSKDSAIFVITNDNNDVITVMNIARGPNGVWKIVSL